MRNLNILNYFVIVVVCFEYVHSYLYIRTNPILHQYLADLCIPSQSCPVQSGVTIHVYQVHPCRTFVHYIYISVEAFN